MCLNFALKALKNEKMKHMFPLRNSENRIKTRNGEIFEVQKANTDRLKKFALIYMQTLLNKHVKRGRI